MWSAMGCQVSPREDSSILLSSLRKAETMNPRAEEKKIRIDLIRGVEGLAVYINDYRVAGPKPWGGGTIEHTWHIEKDLMHKSIERTIFVLNHTNDRRGRDRSMNSKIDMNPRARTVNPPGEFTTDWESQQMLERCAGCDAEGWIWVRKWESDCGGFEDYQFRCFACGKTWWVEGPDS